MLDLILSFLSPKTLGAAAIAALLSFGTGYLKGHTTGVTETDQKWTQVVAEERGRQDAILAETQATLEKHRVAVTALSADLNKKQQEVADAARQKVAARQAAAKVVRPIVVSGGEAVYRCPDAVLPADIVQQLDAIR